jgi:hypothetical protein
MISSAHKFRRLNVAESFVGRNTSNHACQIFCSKSNCETMYHWFFLLEITVVKIMNKLNVILPYVDIDPTIDEFFKRSYSWGIMDKWNKPLSLCSWYICRMVDHPDLNRECGIYETVCHMTNVTNLRNLNFRSDFCRF